MKNGRVVNAGRDSAYGAVQEGGLAGRVECRRADLACLLLLRAAVVSGGLVGAVLVLGALAARLPLGG